MPKTASEVLSSALIFGINPSLDNTERLCTAFGNPQYSFQSISVVGTNGKTSTSRYTAALLQASGQITGLYTSPELIDLTERIEINGQIISHGKLDEAVLNVYEQSLALNMEATQFELLTVAAFLIFRDCKVDVAVLEAGLGGQWDSTAVAQAPVAIFTGIGLDHTHILGDTIEEIARDKAHILTENSTAIISAHIPLSAKYEIMQYADEIGARVYEVEPVEIIQSEPVIIEQFKHQLSNYIVRNLYSFEHNITMTAPLYQLQNTASAINAVELYLGHSLETDLIEDALTSCRIPGRFELVWGQTPNSPNKLKWGQTPIILDSAHNPQAAELLARDFNDFVYLQERKLSCGLLIGVLSDKNAVGILQALTSTPIFTSIAFVTAPSPRAIPAKSLLQTYEQVMQSGLAQPAQSAWTVTNLEVETATSTEVAGAIDWLSQSSDLVLCTGSITLIGQVVKLLE